MLLDNVTKEYLCVNKTIRVVNYGCYPLHSWLLFGIERERELVVKGRGEEILRERERESLW